MLLVGLFCLRNLSSFCSLAKADGAVKRRSRAYKTAMQKRASSARSHPLAPFTTVLCCFAIYSTNRGGVLCVCVFICALCSNGHLCESFEESVTIQPPRQRRVGFDRYGRRQ